MSEKHAVRQFAAELVDGARSGRHDDVADALEVLARSDVPQVHAAVLAELVTGCASLVRPRCPAGAGVFTVDVTDESASRVEVDRLPRAALAALRALLAELGGDGSGRDIQIAIAAGAGPAEVVAAITHLLLWHVELDEAPEAALPPLTCLAD
ncbi:hypothetical protein [Amycolatopsis suaedae]|uniref:Uncharacterized protein n=1 Tax=Amycolatopsis suaedae TaxID=2510978 RepID=A0A4Q7J8G0_9PSEU|nr:hypothetical protein [Amycolatopsis suaedae]RZQ63196.1 hypothetical protein EWH70_16090 [Amycolatopsis suaedae]